MRISLFLDPQEGLTYAEVVAAAQRAEEVGFEGLFRSDHLTSTAGRHEVPATEAWSTLAGLARETSRLRLGTLVTPIGFRPPGLYAKIVGTVDEMSEGRVVASIGTGWYEPEHRILGLPFPPLRDRFARLEEYLEVLTRIWAGQGETFSGDSYALEQVRAHPLTRRRPGPWLLLGGHGRRHTPLLAARFGDEFNIDWRTPAVCEELYAIARAECERLGRDPDTLRRSVLLGAIVGRDRAHAEELLEDFMRAFGVEDVDTWRARFSDSWTIGTGADLLARLSAYAAVGVDHVVLMLGSGTDLDMVSRAAEEVLPGLGDL